MRKDLNVAIKKINVAMKNLERFIPMEDKEITGIFDKAFYYLAFGIKGVELYYKELE